MTVTTKSNPADGYYVYQRSDHNHPFVTILKAEGLGAKPWVVSVQLNVGDRYIDSYYDALEKSKIRADKIISSLKKKNPGVYDLV